MKLTDAQLVLLSRACQRDDGALEIPDDLKDSSKKIVDKLLGAKMLEEVLATPRFPVWRREGKEANATVPQVGSAQVKGTNPPKNIREGPYRLETRQGHRDAATVTGSDHCGHHEGNRMAAALGPRLLRRRRAEEARTQTCLQKDR